MNLFNAIEFYEELTNTPGIRNWSGDLSGQTLDVQVYNAKRTLHDAIALNIKIKIQLRTILEAGYTQDFFKNDQFQHHRCQRHRLSLGMIP